MPKRTSSIVDSSAYREAGFAASLFMSGGQGHADEHTLKVYERSHSHNDHARHDSIGAAPLMAPLRPCHAGQPRRRCRDAVAESLSVRYGRLPGAGRDERRYRDAPTPPDGALAGAMPIIDGAAMMAC